VLINRFFFKIAKITNLKDIVNQTRKMATVVYTGKKENFGLMTEHIPDPELSRLSVVKILIQLFTVRLKQELTDLSDLAMI